MFKKIFNYLFRKQNIVLLEYVSSLEKQLNEFPAFTTLKIPSNDKLQGFLAELGKNEYYLFYLLAIENELVESFINGKESDIYKGGLKAISRIKLDCLQAVKNEKMKLELQNA